MISAVNESDSGYSYKLITYCITVWFIIRTLKDQDHLRTFLLSIPALCGALSILAYFEGERVHARLEGIGANDAFEANQFALLIVGILPMMLPLILRGRKHEKIVCLIFLPFILNAFILCNSRGAAVAMLAGLVYATFVVADKLLRKRMIIAVICIFPLFLYLTDQEYITRISTFWNTKETIEGDDALSELSSGRTEIWVYGLRMVKDHPLGAGPNSFKHLARYYMPPELLSFKPGVKYGIRAAHNTYLQILVEQGYLGFLIWITLCIHTLLILMKSAKKLKSLDRSDTFMGYTIFGLNFSFFCSLIGGLTMSRIYYEFFWWQVALSVVAASIITESEEKEKT
jgi:O-antigen ligase